MAAPEPPILTLTNCSVPAAVMGVLESGALNPVDIVIVGGVIADVRPSGVPVVEGEKIDCDKGLVLPCFADIHTHLDKGHIWPRRPNPDGTWLNALLSVQDDRQSLWARDDVERRFDFALRCAYAHGTAAVRTHIDSIPPQHDISWALFEEMRDRWAGRIALQGVSLISPQMLIDPALLDLIARRTRTAGGILGGALHSFPQSREAMRAVVEKAGEYGLDLDIHADECLEPGSQSLLHLAEAVIETGYTGRVVAGHCCSLAAQDEHTARTTIERVAEAKIAIVSLPMCNLYLQDRAETTPRMRGVTLAKELRAAGVPVAIASDNTRDPFYAYGDLDMVEVFREGARILHYDHPQDRAWSWVRSITAGAAEIAGFRNMGTIAKGAPADVIVFRARTWTEFLARPQVDRYVLRFGTPVDTTPPDYRELDDLMGA